MYAYSRNRRKVSEAFYREEEEEEEEKICRLKII